MNSVRTDTFFFSRGILAALLIAGSAYSQNAWTIEGTSRLEVARSRQASTTSRSTTLRNRLTVKGQLGSRWATELSYQLDAGLADGGCGVAPSRFRPADINPTPICRLGGTRSREVVHQDLDRALLSYYGEATTVDVGRQQITRGSGQMVNPTDIFSPAAIFVPPLTERPGVDGIRLRHQLGGMSQLDLGLVAPRTGRIDDAAFYIAPELSLASVELKPILARFYQASLVGIDLGFALANFLARMWLEAAWVEPSQRGSSSQGSRGYGQALLGAMWQLAPLNTIAVEYYLNGAGDADLAQPFAYSAGGLEMRGRHYVGLTANTQVTPLLALSPRLAANLDDGSTFVHLGIDWEATENIYLAARYMQGKFLTGPSGRVHFSAPFNQRPEFPTGSQTLSGAIYSYF